MNNQNETSGNNYHALKCIWMASGLIEYKLCDKQFDCENCPFDRVIRNFSNEEENLNTGMPNIINIILNKLRCIKYDEGIIYLKNNLIARQILPNTYYLGVNPILISFLDNVGIMMECGAGKNVLHGEPIIQFFGEWGTINLPAPMNFSIYDKVNNPADDPMIAKWIAIIGAIPQEISLGKLSKEGWNDLHSRSLELVEEIKLAYSKIGITMNDGGSQIKYFHQLIGKDKYIEILNLINS
jgi:hypothetical protein